MARRTFAATLVVAAALLAAPPARAGGTNILIFSETAAFRHDSIPDAVAAVEQLAADRGWSSHATEDSSEISADNLAEYDAVVFVMTTGDVLSDPEQAALEGFLRAGGGWVGIHSASDTEYDWPWYGELVGAYFAGHPAPQQATIRVLDRDHPATRALPAQWTRTDEWYDFDASPRGRVHVLATLDERTYGGGNMGHDHPIAWCRSYDGGRSFYTALGHTRESWSEPEVLEHVAGGLEYAAGTAGGDCDATIESNYERIVLEPEVHEPMELDVAPDGRVFFIERGGRLAAYDPARARTIDAGTLDVARNHEDGLLGLALAPDFAQSSQVYLYYSPNGGEPVQHLSRFTLVGDALDLGSEEVLLVVPTQRDECCHSGGSLAFDADGNLFVSTGDNTNPFASDGFAPIDEGAGRAAWDAQRTSGNTQDLRGKILRVTPDEGGGISIPAGNLFAPDGSEGRPEVYVMGVRNPFRISVDPVTGVLYWGDVGPDAGDDGARGPRGYDEVNRAISAGNHGWPFCIGDNYAYSDYDFASGTIGAAFSCDAPRNDSPNNTGAADLPSARPAWIWYPYGPSAEFPAVGEGGRTIMAGPVYHFDGGLASSTKLPAYYDGALFIFEWSRNWIQEVKLDTDGTILGIHPFLPGTSFIRPMDMDVGPDGALYVIEYGTGWGDNEDAQVVRVDYAGGRFTPTASAIATPTSGPVPLDVHFSAAGSVDPNGDALRYGWDFDGDGREDAEGAEQDFTYDEAGTYAAQLTVTDPAGHAGVANVTIVAGNTEPRVIIELPIPNALYSLDEHVHYRVRVEDAEDGTTDDCIPCEDVFVQPAVGHDDHAHPQIEQNGCEGSFLTTIGEDPVAENLYFVVTARYTDRGAPGAEPLSASASVAIRPKRRQAELFAAQSGVVPEPTGDVAGGGRNIGFLAHGDWASYGPMDLEAIDTVTFRAASAGWGGRVEVHADAIDGALLATADIPVNGDWQVYSDVTVPITDPGGEHEIFLVFLGEPGQDGLYNLNWLDFGGAGISTAGAPEIPDRPPYDGDCDPPDPGEDGGTGPAADAGPAGGGGGDDDGGCGCRTAPRREAGLGGAALAAAAIALLAFRRRRAWP